MPSPLDQPESPTPSQTPAPDRSAARPLAIEYDKAAAAKDDSEEIHSLDVGGGNVVKLDKLGPMIINSDGVSGNTTRYVTACHAGFSSGGRTGLTSRQCREYRTGRTCTP